MNELKIAIVDDHLLFRRSMTLLINSFKGMNVAIDAENGREFLSKMETTPIDVVLLDIEMPIMDGYETCKQILSKYPEVKILIVSQLSSRESIHKIMELGAQGYFTKNSNPEQLELAIQNVHDEGFYFGLELGSVIKEAILWYENYEEPKSNKKDVFSERELEVLRMICRGYKSKEIAELLFINVRTVESHRNHIMDKSNSSNIIGVILFALKNEYITVEEI
jgi:two-component system response regulator DegU